MGDARHDILRDAFSQMLKTGTPVLGYVLNKVTTRRLGYGHYYRKYGYGYTTSPGDSAVAANQKRSNGTYSESNGDRPE